VLGASSSSDGDGGERRCRPSEEHSCITITVGIGKESVPVERDVFVALFDNSVVSEYVGYT
jgi:hypothetical protein